MKLNKYLFLLGMAALGLTTACDDQSEEITEVEYSRLFSPINLEARIVNQVNVRLSWNAVAGADSYEVQIFKNADQNEEIDEDEYNGLETITGTPVKTVTDITEIPVTITGLDGETNYTAIIRAHGENITSSNWTGVKFKTQTEQIMIPVADEDIEATSVTIRWTVDNAAGCTIELTPGNIRHIITAAEGEAGAATIEGLTGETTYEVKITSADGKTRGSGSFTTAVDLGNAIAVYPEDDLNTVIAGAETGATLALFPGTYTALAEDGTQAKIVVDKDITLKAVRPAERPVINGCFHLTEGASLSASQIVFDGAGSDGSQAFEFKTAGATYAALILDDCEIVNYTKGFYYLNVAATVDEITINNCLIHEIECNGGDMFDSRSGAIRQVNLTNSTVWNSCAARDFFRMDDASGNFPGITPAYNIDHCTLVGVSNNSSRRLFYIRFKGNTISFTNNIVANTEPGRGFTDNANTGVPAFSNNNYYATKNLIANDGGTNLKFFDESGTSLNPKFADAAVGDFTLGDEDLSYKLVGDPRWY